MPERTDTPSRTEPAETLFKLSNAELEAAILAWLVAEGETIPAGTVHVEALPTGANLSIIDR